MAEEAGAPKEGDAKDGEEAPKKKLPLLLIALILQLLVVLGAGGLMIKSVLFTKRPDMRDSTLKERAIASIHEDAQDFRTLPLEEFTVNLAKKHSIKATLQIEIS